METERDIPHWGHRASSNDSSTSATATASTVVGKGDVHFYAKVDDASILQLKKDISAAAALAKQTAFEYTMPEAPPIHLHIHSYGGSVFAGFAGIGTILNCGVPVYTYIEGGAASAATLMSVVGTKRFIYKHSYLLIHQLSGKLWGKYSEFQDELKNQDSLMSTIKDIYREYASIPEDVLETLLQHDLWLNAETALEYNLVDEVI